MVQPRHHRMRKQRRRESAGSWIQSGAKVTIKTYAKRYGVDRYTAYEDLIAIGFALPSSAERWSRRPPVRPNREPDTHANDDWTVIDGRWYFVAGYTPNGVPYGIFEDE
ncbi:MAG: hypothetical protein GEV04_22055 [Actinophytocola sp.]|nr:hypothetical protein [Actinophytocola sp.]